MHDCNFSNLNIVSHAANHMGTHTLVHAALLISEAVFVYVT